jgi:Arm DNA-binding domain
MPTEAHDVPAIGATNLPLGLTDAKLRALPCETGQRDYPDRDGLFVRVGRKTKTFMVAIHAGSQRQRVALGRYPDLSLSAARARELRTEAANKPDTPQLTFEEALEAYFRIHGPKQRPVTRKESRRILNKHFRPYLAKHGRIGAGTSKSRR